jgi:hypothetical protein
MGLTAMIVLCYCEDLTNLTMMELFLSVRLRLHSRSASVAGQADGSLSQFVGPGYRHAHSTTADAHLVYCWLRPVVTDVGRK